MLRLALLNFKPRNVGPFFLLAAPTKLHMFTDLTADVKLISSLELILKYLIFIAIFQF